MTTLKRSALAGLLILCAFFVQSAGWAACTTTQIATGASTSLLFQGSSAPYTPLVDIYDATSGLCGTINGDGGINFHITNLPSNPAQETGGNLAAIATAQGTGGTGISPPTGGSGVLGWLSGIYHALTGTLSVSWSGQAVSVSNLPSTQTIAGTVTSNDGGTAATGVSPPSGAVGLSGWLSGIYNTLKTGTLTTSVSSSVLPSGAAADGTDNTGVAQPSSGVGIRGWLSAIYSKLAGTLSISGSVNASPAAAATGGASSYSEIVPASTTGVSVKATAGTVYEVDFDNIGSAPLWVKLYDTATAPTCGSGTPIRRFMIPANSTPANGGGSNIPLGAAGIAFVNGLGLCVTGGIADTDTTTPATPVATIGISYK